MILSPPLTFCRWSVQGGFPPHIRIWMHAKKTIRVSFFSDLNNFIIFSLKKSLIKKICIFKKLLFKEIQHPPSLRVA